MEKIFLSNKSNLGIKETENIVLRVSVASGFSWQFHCAPTSQGTVHMGPEGGLAQGTHGSNVCCDGS